MPSTMRSVAAVTLALSALSHLAVASPSPVAAPIAAPSSITAGAMTAVGCFNSSTPLTSKGSWKYQSKGYCQTQCVNAGATVMALTDSNTCYCGTTLPAKSSKQSDDSECNLSCVGYPDDPCGGDGYWNVFYTSDDTNVPWYNDGSSASSKSGSNSATSSTTQASSQTTDSTTSGASDKATVITSVAPGKTVVITQMPNAAASTTAANASDDKSHKGGSNTAGIAAGVVVAVVVVAALIGAAYFFWRRRQRQQAETGHQQLSDYSGSGSRPMTYRPAPGPDSRLDHDAMAQRRMSDGSIADNQDYSRRILKVTNPDDR